MSKPEFELIYWPEIPGRGEFIRLLFEATGTAYTDTTDVQQVLSVLSGDSGAVPVFAPPVLRHANLLAQTPAIIAYLAPQLGLAPEGFAVHQMNSLVLTALDFASEVHNTHHPVSVSLYYEDQLPEAKRYSEIFRKERVAKFFGYFERVLKSAATAAGKEGWLLDGKMTAADLVLWQVVDGMKFAFPKASARVLKECPALEKHYELVKGTERIKEYLASERRRKYSKGMFRHYPELDDQGEK